MSRVPLWRQQLRALSAFAIGVAMPLMAHAEPQQAAFSLAYSAPAGSCPSREAFVQAVLTRAPSAHEASTGEAALILDLRLEGSGELAKGALTVRRADGLAARREVPEGACAEVAESLAVIVAMLLEQREFVEPSRSFGTNTAQASNEPPAEPAANAPPPAEPLPRRVAERPLPARALAPSARATSASSRARPAWGLALTFASVVESEASPSLAPGLLLGVEGWWERESPWSPSLRLAAYQIDAGREVTVQGGAHFRLRALRLSACPLRWLARRWLAVHGCALFDAGELQARGDVPGGKTLTMPWLAAGAGGRLAVPVLPFLVLEAEAGLQALSRHDEFVLEPGAFSVHSLGQVTLGAGLGLTLRTF